MSPKVRQFTANFNDICAMEFVIFRIKAGWLALLCVFCSGFLAAQQDSLQYIQGFSFQQGIYLNFEQFRTNHPVPKSDIVFDADTSRLDFIKLALSKDNVQWRDSSGNIQTTKLISLWGYSENNAVYIRMGYSFNRIMVIGSICHFTAYVTNYMSTGPGTYPNQQYGAPVESLQQFVLDMKTGATYDFNSNTMLYLLSRDPQLYGEFSALKKRKRREQIFIFLRKYNERHLLYFPE